VEAIGIAGVAGCGNTVIVAGAETHNDVFVAVTTY
jgi:hypothetical protein